MRPLGDLSRALIAAAFEHPGTVRQLAERAQVGFGAAEYTASRLVDRGQLIRLNEGRPAVLGAPPICPCGDELGDALAELNDAFWREPPSVISDAASFDAL